MFATETYPKTRTDGSCNQRSRPTKNRENIQERVQSHNGIEGNDPLRLPRIDARKVSQYQNEKKKIQIGLHERVFESTITLSKETIETSFVIVASWIPSAAHYRKKKKKKKKKKILSHKSLRRSLNRPTAKNYAKYV